MAFATSFGQGFLKVLTGKLQAGTAAESSIPSSKINTNPHFELMEFVDIDEHSNLFKGLNFISFYSRSYTQITLKSQLLLT